MCRKFSPFHTLYKTYTQMYAIMPKSKFTTPLKRKEYQMEDTVKTRRNPLAWFGKHKKLTALLLVVLIAAVLVLRAVLGGKKAAGSTYQFVRTSTLQKTSLTDSVSVNGTVKSGYEASVTVADSAKLYKVSEVKVAVGDTVKKGDVIATLDTSDLEKQIESAEESYGDTLKSAQTSYDRATADLETSTVQHENSLIDLQAKIDQADQNLQDAKDALTKAQENERKTQSTYDTAVSDYNTLKSAYDSASASISTYTAALNAAADAQNQAISAVNSAIAAYNADPSDANKDAMNAANDNLKSAQEAYQSAQASLTDAQNSCSAPSLGLYGFTSIQTALTQADSTKTQAESALDSAKNAVDTANTQISTCEKNYSNLLNKSQNVEDSATKLEQAQRTPDNLETLRSTLEDCTLTATMDGTITALNATVGSVCSGTVATIQNTDALVVDVTIPANSVPKLSTGMTCHITSDATGDAVIDGTLTQIDPVANDNGSFGAKVVVNGDADGLLIGISAKVEIVISEKDNVFIVPRDAVGTADDGSSYVLRKTGGEGVDMTFEQVTVTTGDTNDFYVEITGSDLQEGDVIRSSADLTQGIETSSDSTLPDGVQQTENGDLYVGDPSNMPEGTVVMGGGDAPAGGPDGGPGGGQ